VNEKEQLKEVEEGEKVTILKTAWKIFKDLKIWPKCWKHLTYSAAAAESLLRRTHCLNWEKAHICFAADDDSKLWRENIPTNFVDAKKNYSS
jgi:hypothetical protein